MKRNVKTLTLLALAVSAFAVSVPAAAANLSGQLFRQNPSGPHPTAAAGYQVYLYSQATRTWAGPVLTDSQGRYTFYNQNDGKYLLRVNLNGTQVWQQEVQIPGAVNPVVL